MACSCKKKKCACTITGGTGVHVSGNGSQRNPYIPKAVAFALQAIPNDAVQLVITGSGTTSSPWSITATAADGSGSTSTIFTVNGTWNKPPGGGIVRVQCIGGGGGGGAAGGKAHPSGGGGGAGGAHSIAWIPASALPDSVDVTVGAGGKGAQTFINDSNQASTSGGNSYFGAFLAASGGQRGHSQGAEDSPPGPFTDPSRIATPPEGGYGGSGGAREISIPVVPAVWAPSGGGLGKGPTSGATGSGNSINLPPVGKGGNGGGWGGSGPEPGYPGQLYGGGGGGGAVDPDWNPAGGGGSGSGGTGSIYDPDPNRAAGGDGAPGIVIVTVW